MRTLEQINNEYAAKCARLGDLVAKQRSLHSEAEDILRQITALQDEAEKLNAASAADEEK